MQKRTDGSRESRVFVFSFGTELWDALDASAGDGLRKMTETMKKIQFTILLLNLESPLKTKSLKRICFSWHPCSASLIEWHLPMSNFGKWPYCLGAAMSSPLSSRSATSNIWRHIQSHVAKLVFLFFFFWKNIWQGLTRYILEILRIKLLNFSLWLRRQHFLRRRDAGHCKLTGICLQFNKIAHVTRLCQYLNWYEF